MSDIPLQGYTGLYYPFSSLPEQWIKAAVLYWDGIGRVVPPGYQYHDSEAVRWLKENKVIYDYVPTRDDISPVSNMFSQLLADHAEALERHYRVLSVDKGDRHSIYYKAKMSMHLGEELLKRGLAVPREDEEGAGIQFELHPKLYLVYMEALAEQMARNRPGLYPVADNLRDYIALGGYTPERLAQALLEEVDSGPPPLAGPVQGAQEMESRLATIAIKMMLPGDLEHVPIQKIIELRVRYGTQVIEFQKMIQGLAAHLGDIEKNPDPQARDQALQQIYRRHIAPQVAALEESLRSLAVSTVPAMLGVNVEVPAFLGSAPTAFHLGLLPPEVLGTAAIAYSVIPVFKQVGDARREQARKAPATTYLLHIKDDLATDFVRRVVNRIRRMLFGIY